MGQPDMARYRDQSGSRLADRRSSLQFFRVAAIAVMLAIGPIGCMAQIQYGKIQAEKTGAADNKVHAAQQILEQLFHAYEAGDSISSQSFFDPAMQDMQSLLDNIRDTQSQQKQIHISTSDIRTVAEADSVLIQLNWEKRYLVLVNMMPKLTTGHATFQMKYTSQGWRLAGIGGDNVFAASAK